MVAKALEVVAVSDNKVLAARRRQAAELSTLGVEHTNAVDLCHLRGLRIDQRPERRCVQAAACYLTLDLCRNGAKGDH